MNQTDEIKKLIEETEKQYASQKNIEIAKKWEAPKVTNTFFHCTPKREGQMPVVADLEYPMWAKLLNFKLRDYYYNPLTYVQKQLEMNLFRYNYFNDDAGVGKLILIWFGAPFEASFLGCEVQYPENFDPSAIRKEILIKDRDDLKRFEEKEIDFYKDGELGRAHEFYHRIKEVLPSDWLVIFPDWIISVFGIALYLRGYQNLLMDLKTDPGFVADIMKAVKDKMFFFSKKRSEFLGIPIEKICLHNDDINYPNLMKGQYKELILPIENEISDFYDGILYWHSCGEVSDFVEEILDLKKLSTLDCSGWNDFDTFVNAIIKKGLKGVAIEKRFHPVKDVLSAPESEIRAKIKGFYESMQKDKDLRAYMRIDGIGQIEDFQKDLERVKRFVDISREFCFED
jgi:hypothetical protein